ncbi:MAG: hypothetical protein RMJ17_03870 [Candidatus Aenigmarchaeota archaeon]|nr:hypothetical protein [Candidatus Aenigmarchaeota archaeon]MDW8149698.1 hypothetical protein [Candidatus Aenigmarchaeota archaeon]
MAVIRFEDDCMEPTAKLKIEYRGPNPFEAYKRVLELLKVKLGISENEIFERDFRWDNTSDEKSGFFIRVYVMKKHDIRTHTFIELIFEGSQPRDVNKTGDLSISIITKLVTNYFLDTPIEKTIFYKLLLKFYHNNFYKNVRERFFEECRTLSEKIVREIKNAFGIV